MRDIWCQVRRGYTVKNTLLVFALVFYALLFPNFDVPLFYSAPLKYFSAETFYYYFLLSFNDGLLRYIIPIAAMIPFGFFFVEDKTCRFYDMEAGRISSVRFVLHRFIAALITTVLLIGAACLAFVLLLLALCPLTGGSGAGESWLQALAASPYGWFAEAGHFRFYVLWQIGLLLVSSMIWVLVAISFSFLWTNKAFVFIATFGSSLLLDNLLERFAGTEYTLYFLQVPDFIVSSTPLLQHTLREIGYLCIAVILFAVLALWRFSSKAQLLRDQHSQTCLLQKFIPYKEKKLPIPSVTQGSWLARLIADVTVSCSKATILPAVVVPAFILLCKAKDLTGKNTFGDLLMHVFGGIYWFDPVVNFESIGYWILILLPCMLGTAINLDREMGNRMYLSVHRYPSAFQWWVGKYLACDIYVVINALFLFATVIVIGVVTRASGFGIWMADEDGFPVLNSGVVFLLFHIFVWQLLFLTQIQIFFHAVSNQNYIGFIAHLLPLLWVMISFSIFDRPHNVNIPYHWGMILRSGLFSPSSMLSDDGGEIPLCAIDLRYCVYGQMVLTTVLGSMNSLLGKVIRFQERRQNA